MLYEMFFKGEIKKIGKKIDDSAQEKEPQS
jgi:hypothetical protein